ncbi:MAG TPA: recombinase family protein [Candidatus Polarisedimenticolia bacterium]|nr:recombinase family protein [Candidatus Polarisedimenticolia bacterium]
MNVAVYLRVSTGRQDEANQEPACLQICQARGWTPRLYRERVSGVKEHRPEWSRLLNDARTGVVQGVVFYSISRIGRRRIQIAHDLAELSRWGMALVSVRESFLDTGPGAGGVLIRDLLIQWWGWFAEREREDLIDKTNRAMTRIKGNLATNGVHTSPRTGRTIKSLGRPRKFDWDVWKPRALALNDGTRTPAGIARQLMAEGCPKIHRTTVRGWVKEKTR